MSSWQTRNNKENNSRSPNNKHQFIEQTLQEQTLREQTLQEQTLREQTLQEQTLQEQTLQEQTLQENIINENIICVTSSTFKMYELNGRNFINSYLKNISEMKLLYVTENFKLDIVNDNIIEYDVNDDIFLNDWLTKFEDVIPLNLNGKYDINSNKYNYMSPKTDFNVKNKLFKGDWNYKASLWFRKIAALNYAHKTFKDSTIIWIDIDSIVRRNITKTDIKSLFSNKDFFYIHSIRRDNKDYGIEAGLMGFNKYDILADIIKCYTSGDFIKYNRWDDGYIIKQIVFSNKHKHNINNINDVGGNYIQHLKGSHWRSNIDYNKLT
jgi:hypothetical protein